MNTLIIILTGTAIVAAISIMANILQAKHIDPSALAEKANSGLALADAVAGALIPYVGAPATTVKAILDAAGKAVPQVEAVYKAAISTAPDAADARKATATSLIQSALTLDGIKVDADANKLIDAAITVLAAALPKTHIAPATTGAVIDGPAKAAE